MGRTVQKHNRVAYIAPAPISQHSFESYTALARYLVNVAWTKKATGSFSSSYLVIKVEAMLKLATRKQAQLMWTLTTICKSLLDK
jgi:hypothetical protein